MFSGMILHFLRVFNIKGFVVNISKWHVKCALGYATYHKECGKIAELPLISPGKVTGTKYSFPHFFFDHKHVMSSHILLSYKPKKNC